MRMLFSECNFSSIIFSYKQAIGNRDLHVARPLGESSVNSPFPLLGDVSGIIILVSRVLELIIWQKIFGKILL